MFSFFKKLFGNTKQDEQEHVEPEATPPVPVPEFDYTARVPEGWKIYVSRDDFAEFPITSYGQVRRALEEIQELASNKVDSFVIISNDTIPNGHAAASCYEPESGPDQGLHFYRTEVQISGEGGYFYGKPIRKGKAFLDPKIDDTALILCTFIRDGGKLPEFPHLAHFYEKD